MRLVGKPVTTIPEHIQTFLENAKTGNKEFAVADTFYPGLGSSTSQILKLLDSASKHRDAEDFLVIGDVVAQGGMSSVLSAKQKSVDREVVVKIPVKSEDYGDATKFMLREARITAQLEHPNIVPVYDIATGKDNVPMIVMRHISGCTWQDVIRQPDAIDKNYGASNPLQWNLKVLMQIALAVEFAHAKGFVHRDLKPSNVLIGEQGEAYLFDWGIAYEMNGDNNIDEEIGVAGTPAYIAPEMLDGNTKRIGPKTDVFLLGAVLYEIMAGHPPFHGDTLSQVITLARESKPVFDMAYPDELVDICRRALSADLDARTPTVAVFVKELESFFEHLHSISLESSTSATLEKLIAKLNFAKLEDETEKTEVYRIYEECKFGFLNSLRLWPDNKKASQGLKQVVSLMVQTEMKRGDYAAASTLLASSKISFPGLEKKVRLAQKNVRAESASHKEYVEIGKSHSEGVYKQARKWVMVGIMMAFALLPIVLGARDHLGYIKSSLFGLVGLGVFAAVSWKNFFGSMYNRRLTACLLTIFVLKIIVSGASMKLGIPETSVASHHIFMCLAGVMFIASTITWKMTMAIPGYAIGYVWTLYDPAALPLCETLGHSLLAFSALLLWDSRDVRPAPRSPKTKRS